MVVNPNTFVRKLISLPREMVQAIKTYRHQHEIDTEAETIRQLIDLGLKPASTAPREAVGRSAALSQAGEPAPDRPLAPRGPFPWLDIPATQQKKTGLSLSLRLQTQLKWIQLQEANNGRDVTIQSMVEAGTREYVERALQARGAPL